MKNIFIALLLMAIMAKAEWTGTQVTNQLNLSGDIKNELTQANIALSYSMYNPMEFKPSMIDPEAYDDLDIDHGKGSTWYDSWILDDSNASRYMAMDTRDSIGSLGYSMGKNIYGVAGLSNGDESGYWSMYPSNVVLSDGISVDHPNAVGMQFNQMNINEYKVTDTKIYEKTSTGINLINSFQQTVQTYLNYQYNNQPLFEIDLEGIGLFWERLKERLPGYVIPDSPTNVFMGKKISCSLVPTQGTLLYTIHQYMVSWRDYITYCMWGFLVFEIFTIIVSYADNK